MVYAHKMTSHLRREPAASFSVRYYDVARFPAFKSSGLTILC